MVLYFRLNFTIIAQVFFQIMKFLLVIALCINTFNIFSQKKITTINFLQAGAVPETITEKGNNISSSGLAFNITHFETAKFFRMDATWLFRYIFNGTKDSANFNDSNQVAGLDLPVFTATYGRNIIRRDNFSLGLGLNLDSRTFYSPPSQQKAQK